MSKRLKLYAIGDWDVLAYSTADAVELLYYSYPPKEREQFFKTVPTVYEALLERGVVNMNEESRIPSTWVRKLYGDLSSIVTERRTSRFSEKEMSETRGQVLYRPKGRRYQAQKKYLKHCTSLGELSKEKKAKLLALARKLDINVNMSNTKDEICSAIYRYYTERTSPSPKSKSSRK